MSDIFDKVTLRQIQIFLAVVEHRNFFRAAAQLQLTPPAVSMQMSRLSETLGAPLFDKEGRSIQLTPAATALIPFAERMTNRFVRLAALLTRSKVSWTVLCGWPWSP